MLIKTWLLLLAEFQVDRFSFFFLVEEIFCLLYSQFGRHCKNWVTFSFLPQRNWSICLFIGWLLILCQYIPKWHMYPCAHISVLMWLRGFSLYPLLCTIHSFHTHKSPASNELVFFRCIKNRTQKSKFVHILSHASTAPCKLFPSDRRAHVMVTCIED